mmetsp:Transcript_27236/g.67176  ORF Transcript_27236/g.67176 Transcript_27236/m.67176 type:complete len:271 (+) Transcript_27236:5696-6508(+)
MEHRHGRQRHLRAGPDGAPWSGALAPRRRHARAQRQRPLPALGGLGLGAQAAAAAPPRARGPQRPDGDRRVRAADGDSVGQQPAGARLHVAQPEQRVLQPRAARADGRAAGAAPRHAHNAARRVRHHRVRDRLPGHGLGDQADHGDQEGGHVAAARLLRARVLHAQRVRARARRRGALGLRRRQDRARLPLVGTQPQPCLPLPHRRAHQLPVAQGPTQHARGQDLLAAAHVRGAGLPLAGHVARRRHRHRVLPPRRPHRGRLPQAHLHRL